VFYKCKSEIRKNNNEMQIFVRRGRGFLGKFNSWQKPSRFNITVIARLFQPKQLFSLPQRQKSFNIITALEQEIASFLAMTLQINLLY